MKFAMTSKELKNKEVVATKMEKSLKKTIQFLEDNKGTRLPFYYQFGYISEQESFISIGEAKEVHKEWKARLKGKGHEGTIDKKTVAAGEVYVDEKTGVFKFVVKAGLMKRAQVRIAFRSVGAIKKKIKENYEIVTSEAPVVEEEGSSTLDNVKNVVEGAVETVKDAAENVMENIAASAEELVAAVQEFKKNEWETFKSKKDGANGQAVLAKGKVLSQQLEALLAKEENKKAVQAKKFVDAKVGQVEGALSKAKGKKAAGSLDKVATDIHSAIEDLLSNFGEEVDGIGDTLKATLDKLKA